MGSGAGPVWNRYASLRGALQGYVRRYYRNPHRHYVILARVADRAEYLVTIEYGGECYVPDGEEGSWLWCVDVPRCDIEELAVVLQLELFDGSWRAKRGGA